MKFPRRRAKIPGKNQILGSFLAKLCKAVNSSSCREKFTPVLKHHGFLSPPTHPEMLLRLANTHGAVPRGTAHWANIHILSLLLAPRPGQVLLCELLLLLDCVGLELATGSSTDPPDGALSLHFYGYYPFQLSPSATPNWD